ncbi:spore cortex biosynthesis protein YabQ [Petralouisia muris]|uniref:Spore cortex biosynthesis protein YabQ n=1 Tax=Petralouisia muris TaxID=3032872 RepID=A0AC61RSF9_9FIRM|nr:spore cortex biosynthesis protein YabQ [Petralouisia muris]
MMQVSAGIIKEADVLLASFFTGMILLFVYDLLRIMRRLISHKAWVTGAEDLLFWIGSAIALFAMLYRENSGYIRGFVIGGVLVGMLIYNLLLSAWVVKGSVFLLEKILFLVGRPLVWTARILKGPLGHLKKMLKKVLRFWKKQLKKIWKAVRIGLCKL